MRIREERVINIVQKFSKEKVKKGVTFEPKLEKAGEMSIRLERRARVF